MAMLLPYPYVRCSVSVAPLRKEAAHRSEQVSQLLWGEKAEIIEHSANGWTNLRCANDSYEGWCLTSQYEAIGGKEWKKDARFYTCGTHSHFAGKDTQLWLPAGSEINSSKYAMGDEHFRFKGKKLARKQIEANAETLKQIVTSYLHTPYQWGGRTIAGIDCSGLMQLAYKLCGIAIPRDAWQQAGVGRTIDFLQEGMAGDLAFFDNEEGHITHVGMLLDNQTIAHATATTGRVVVDRIDNGGIISIQLKKRTHKLRVVKRVLPAALDNVG